MALTEKLETTIPAAKNTDRMEVELGGNVIAHRGQARSTRLIGLVVANTNEGMLEKRIVVPEGIVAVDEKYVLRQMQNSDASTLTFGHFNEEEKVMINGVPAGKRGRGDMGD